MSHNVAYSAAGLDIGTALPRVWQVLIVDDDPEVHEVTRLSLRQLSVLGRRLQVLHAHSAAEALAIQQREPDLAVILLDVVMETPDAGLNLVKTIRSQDNGQEVRIILRTGQPGYAPEESVIQDYDINDYKTKQDLTHTHLLTCIVTALRSFQQIRTINQNRLGLHRIIAASNNLLETTSLADFASGVITQLCSLLGLSAEGMVCAEQRAGHDLDMDPAANADIFVLGAAGQLKDFIHRPLDDIGNTRLSNRVRECLTRREHMYSDQDTVLFAGGSRHNAAIYIQTGETIAPFERQLIELFLQNISVAYQNVTLFQQLSRAAYVDPLTGLPNRNEFIRLLNQQQTARTGAVALIDLRQFSDINDGLGQDVGDEVLRAVARRLRMTYGQDAIVARVGADVFGLIGDESILNPLSLLAVFDSPFRAGDQDLLVAAKMGLGQLNLMGTHGLSRLKRAFIALNAAKRNVLSHYAFYVPEMENDTQQRLALSRSLREALAGQKLQVWYQPQIDLQTRTICGVEALLRWPQANGEFIPPTAFIPVAEHSGLIVDIGNWVVDQVCADLAALSSAGFPELRVAINISMPQFRTPGFITRIMNALSRNAIEARRLELEITESLLMDEPDIVVKALRQLKQLGVSISIDDFGTGYSSLSYLRHLPLDRMKVDRSFVRDIDQPGGRVIIESILNLGQQLGLRTIAEGIENKSQQEFVLAHGCDEAQGFLYAPALALPALLQFMQGTQSEDTHPP